MPPRCIPPGGGCSQPQRPRRQSTRGFGVARGTVDHMDVNPSSDGAPSLSRKPGLAAVPAQAPYTPKLIVPHTTSNSKPGPRFLSLGAFSLWLGYSRSWAYLHRIRLLRGGLPMYRFGKGLRVDVESRRFAAWLRKHKVDLNEK